MRLQEAIRYDHRSTNADPARVTWLDAEDARGKSPGIAETALKRLESPNDLKVFVTTYDQVRRTLEANGIVFLISDQGEGVMIVHAGDTPAKTV